MQPCLTQHCKGKGKVEQSRERNSASPTLWCSSLSKRQPLGHQLYFLLKPTHSYLLSPQPSQQGLKNTLNVSFQRGKTTPNKECPEYDTKQSNGEAPIMLSLCKMKNTPSLTSLPGST